METREQLPPMPAADVVDAVHDWLEENYGWHRASGIAVGVQEATGLHVKVRAVEDALRELGDDRIACCAKLLFNGRTRPVWTRARWLT